MKHLGLLEELLKDAVRVDNLELRRYSNGELLLSRECGEKVEREYGAPWLYVTRLYTFG